MLIISVPCESIRSNSGCAMLLIAKINKKSFTEFSKKYSKQNNILPNQEKYIALLNFLLHLVESKNKIS